MDVIDRRKILTVNQVSPAGLGAERSADPLLVLERERSIIISEDTVLVEGEVAAHVEAEVFRQALAVIRLYFDTVLLDSTLVEFLGTVAYPHRSVVVNGDEHLVAVLVEEVYVNGEVPVEESHFDTEVTLEGLFPLDEQIGTLVLDYVAVGILAEFAHIEPAVVCIVATHKTFREAEFQLAEYGLQGLEKLFFRNYPSDCSGGEETEAVLGREAL